VEKREKAAREQPKKITYSLEGSKECVGNDFSASRGSQETNSLVLSSLGSENPLVNILEHLVETELSETLSRVTNKGSVPSLKILVSVWGLTMVNPFNP
jgi:hypothetical protein